MEELTDTGSYVNSILIKNASTELKTGDLIQFGKDRTIYEFKNLLDKHFLKTSLLDGKVSLINKENLSSKQQMNHLEESYSGNGNIINQKINLNNRNDEEFKNTLKATLSNDKNVTYETLDKLKTELHRSFTKNNALMIHASFLQKKLDVYEFEKQELLEENQYLKNHTEIGRMTIEKDILLNILNRDIELYLEENQNLKNIVFSNQDSIQNELAKHKQINIDKRTEKLLDSYINENKKLKRIVYEIKRGETYCNKRWNEIIQENNILNEKCLILVKQLNEQKHYYNVIIEEYDNKIKSLFSIFPKLLNEIDSDSKKADAASYLIEQMNFFMSDRRNFLTEKLEKEELICLLRLEIDSLKQKLDDYHSYHVTDGKGFSFKKLQDRINELEDIISQNQITLIPNQVCHLQNIISNLNLKIHSKEEQVKQLAEKMKQYHLYKNVIFDQNNSILSLKEAINEKDIMIVNLLNEGRNSKIIDTRYLNNPRSNSYELLDAYHLDQNYTNKINTLGDQSLKSKEFVDKIEINI